MAAPHALLVPYPAQGHVIPLLELAYCLADRGFDITFVNTEFNHNRVVAAMSKAAGDTGRINLVSVPDGMDPGEDRNDLGKLTVGVFENMPRCVENLIRNTNESEENKFTCMIVDQSLGWLLQVAKKMELRPIIFSPPSAALLVMLLSIPKLMEDKIIDTDGLPLKSGMFQLSPGMPSMDTAHFAWNLLGDEKTRQLIFNFFPPNVEATYMAEYIICNTFFEIEQPAFAYNPKLIPIGPLLTGDRFGKAVGHFWPEDATCTAWLDEQPANSVVYVAFGSFTIFEQRQFQELALGLELTGKRFLWVVRPDLTDGVDDAYPSGFRERVKGRGRMVGWAPQQRVLAHPSIACFVTHCGWNSTMEGVRNGVPFLCWPYFADQFLDRNYICDVWKTGVKVIPGSDGTVSKEEIKLKLEELFGNEKMKARALAMKNLAEKSIAKGGSSYMNFNKFVDDLKYPKIM